MFRTMNKRYSLVNKTIVAVSVLFFGSLSLCGQSLNPEVRVTNVYEGKLMETHKPIRNIFIPDSLSRFDLDFKYSVFNNPYKGSYEFNPYLLDMKPEPDAYSGKSFYLKAGTGYAMRPEFDIIISPKMDGRFQMSIYDHFHSMFGDFKSLYLNPTGGKIPGTTRYDAYKITSDIPSEVEGNDKDYSGHDFENNIGVEGRYDWDNGVFNFNVGYYTLGTKDTTATRRFDAFDVNLGAQSHVWSRFYYNVAFAYRYGKDKPEYSLLPNMIASSEMSKVKKYTDEHLLDFSGEFGPMFNNGKGMLTGLNAKVAHYDGDFFKNTAGVFNITHKFVYTKEIFRADLGLKLELQTKKNQQLFKDVEQFDKKGQIIYPEVHFSYEAVKQHLAFYGNVVGGTRINTYSSLLKRDHYFSLVSNSLEDSPVLDNTVEKVNASLGMRGNIASRFNFDLNAGYAILANEVADCLPELTEQMPDVIHGEGQISGIYDGLSPHFGITYADYNMFYVNTELAFKSQSFNARAYLTYRNVDVNKDDKYRIIKPASIVGGINLEYNYRSRIFAGVFCDFSGKREGYVLGNNHSEAEQSTSSVQPSVNQTLEIPGYADLGVTAGYRFTKKLSFWLKSGNLLQSDVHRGIGHVDNGIYVTAGLCLNL